MRTNAVYLLHISPPYKHAGHYLGSAVDVDLRFAEHVAGKGARLTQVAVAAGCELHLVKVWPGGRELERQLKNQKAAPMLCPICRNQRKASQWQLSFDWLFLQVFTLNDVEELAF